MPNLSQPLLLPLHFPYIVPCQALCSLWPPPPYLMWVPLKSQPPFNKPPNELSCALILNRHTCLGLLICVDSILLKPAWIIHNISAASTLGHLHVVFFYLHGSTPLKMRRQNIYSSERPSRKKGKDLIIKISESCERVREMFNWAFLCFLLGLAVWTLMKDLFIRTCLRRSLLNWAVAHHSDSWLLQGSQVTAQRKRKENKAKQCPLRVAKPHFYPSKG